MNSCTDFICKEDKETCEEFYSGKCSGEGQKGYNFCGCEICNNYVMTEDVSSCKLNSFVSVCTACGNKRRVKSVCSIFGAQTDAYCDECIAIGKENYLEMVMFIANAGHFPDDINEVYQTEVRRQLQLHNISETQFIRDVDRMIEDEMEMFSSEK